MTIGDLVTENQPPSPATRRQIAAALDKVQKSFELLGDAMNSVAEILEDARALLAQGDDEPAPESRNPSSADAEV